MRDLLFLFIFSFIRIKGIVSSPRQGLLTSFNLLVKCLKCAINPLFTFFEEKRLSSRLPPLFCVKLPVFSKQQQIFTNFNRHVNLKGEAGFKKETELDPNKCPTSSTFTFKRLCNSKVKMLTICLGLWCLC